MRRAANQQHRRAEMMRGGAVVEPEIAMPQFRYVAQFSKRFSSPIPLPAIVIFGRILSLNLFLFLRPDRVPAATNKNHLRCS